MLRGMIYLIDSRHAPADADKEFLDLLAATGVPTLIALTKVDKLKTRQRQALKEKIIDPLGLSEEQVVLSSSKTGEGAESLLETMMSLLEEEDSEESPEPTDGGSEARNGEEE